MTMDPSSWRTGWAQNVQVGLGYIQSGSPWENGNVESFHAGLRAELFERERFFSVAEANAMLENWREEYNAKRPHGNLGHFCREARRSGNFRSRLRPALQFALANYPRTMLGGF